MNRLSDIQMQAKLLIQNNKLQTCCEYLAQSIKPESDSYDIITIILNNVKDLKAKYQLGILSEGEYSIQQNRLAVRLLDKTNSLEVSDILMIEDTSSVNSPIISYDTAKDWLASIFPSIKYSINHKEETRTKKRINFRKIDYLQFFLFDGGGFSFISKVVDKQTDFDYNTIMNIEAVTTISGRFENVAEIRLIDMECQDSNIDDCFIQVLSFRLKPIFYKMSKVDFTINYEDEASGKETGKSGSPEIDDYSHHFEIHFNDLRLAKRVKKCLEFLTQHFGGFQREVF